MSSEFSLNQPRQRRSIAQSIFIPLGIFIAVRYVVLPLIAINLPGLDLESVYVNVALLVFAAILIVSALYGFARADGLGLRDLYVRRVPAKSFLLIVPVYMAYLSALIIAMFIIKQFVGEELLMQEQRTGFEQAATQWQLIFSGLSLIVVASVYEEFMFRGYMFSGLRNKLGFWLSAVITSGLFALAHGQLNVAIDTFLLGIALAFIVEKTKSIWVAVGLHSFKNAIAFTLAFLL